MNLIRISGPPALCVSLAEAKAQLRVAYEDTDQDAMIAGHLRAAQDHLDGATGWLNKALTTQSWLMYLDGWPPCETIQIPLPPCQSVDSLSYVDPDGATQTITDFVVYGLGGDWPARLSHAYGTRWPSTRRQGNAIEVTFTAGYVGFSAPESIKAAILLMVQGLYDGCSHLAAIDALLMPHRTW